MQKDEDTRGNIAACKEWITPHLTASFEAGIPTALIMDLADTLFDTGKSLHRAATLTYAALKSVEMQLPSPATVV